MQLQFNKTVIPCLHTIKRELQIQEQTQEVRLSEEMPDIGNVLACWGQPVIRGKEWRSGTAGVSCGVMVWVLYTPEDGGEPQTIESWLPFQMRWDLPDVNRDGTICAVPMLRSIDARTLSARKLMVRGSLGVLGEMRVVKDVEVFAPGELPEDVQVLERAFPVCIPAEAGEKAFNMEETLPLSASDVEIARLISYRLHPKVMENKVVSDKLVVRGCGELNLLYMGSDGRLHSWNLELPFSQYADLDREYDADADATIDMAVTSLELERGEGNQLQLKAGITAQYVILDHSLIRVVEDMYSPCRKLEMTQSQLQLPAVLHTDCEHVQIDHNIPTDILEIADVVYYPDQPQIYRGVNDVTAELTGHFQVLGYDSDGALESLVSRWEGSWQKDADGNAQIQFAVSQPDKCQVMMSGGAVSLRGEQPLQVQAYDTTGFPMITGVELSQPVTADPDRPSLILQRSSGKSLWELAKETGSTVEQILQANGLEQEPQTDTLLLIPVL